MPQTTRYAVIDPATDELVATYPAATDTEVRAAVDAAHRTTSWGRATTVAERTALLTKVADLHRERRLELAVTIVREMGKSQAEAEAEVDFCVDIYTYYAGNAETFLADEHLPVVGGQGAAVLRRSPLGVLLGIMPWNFPAYQVARFAAPNLAAGNTIVLKHAPQCPATAAALEQILRDAGFPEGAYVNIYATNEQIADVIADPRVQGVSLTGSERAGAAVAEIAGRHLKKVVLELGGSDPFIVLSTDDLDATVDMAVAQGATFRSAGERHGAYHPAGVLTGVTTKDEVAQQELFGPVALVFSAADEDEAVEIANGTPYGLGSYLITTDPEQAQRVADRIDAGMIFINGIQAESADLPFGGIKRSGFGRELGRHGIEEFVNSLNCRVLVGS